MAYYYVKSGGTATGDGGRYATQQTGTFASLGASGYYDNLVDALGATTSVASGDFICVASDHSHSYTSSISYVGVSDYANDAVTCVSVDVSNCDQEKSGAHEQTSYTSNQSMTFQELWHFRSMSFGSDRQINVNSGILFEDCTLYIDNTSYDLNIQTYADPTFRNCTITWGTASDNNSIRTLGRCSVSFYGCTFTTPSTTLSTLFFNAEGTVGRFHACSFSGFDYMHGTVSSLYGGPCEFTNCDLGSDFVDWRDSSGADKPMSYRVHAAGNGSTSGEQEYQFHYSIRGHAVDEDTGKYRDGSTAFPSGTKSSLKAVTGSRCGQNEPFVFDMPTRYAELSDTGSDTIRIYILSSTTLTDQDVWSEVYYSDGTSTHVPNLVSTVPADLFATGTTLTTNTEAWTGRTSENRYQIDLNTSGDAGADCVPFIRVGITKASSTIYFCTSVDLI